MSTSARLKGLAAVTASAALVLSSAGVASAQGNVIPGDRYDGRTAIVNAASGEFTVAGVDRASGIVDIAFTNNSGGSLRCEAPNPDPNNRPGSTVSTAPVIEAATEYYQRFQVVPAGEIDIEQSIPLLGGINIYAAFWPLLQLIPSGSAAQFMSDRVQLQATIVDENRHAKTNGLTGTATPFTVDSGATWTGQVQLGPPSTSPRGENKVGAIVVCGPGGTQGNQQLYAWSAFEEGWPAADEGGGDSGSLDAGSLGSSDNADGSLETGSLGGSGSAEGGAGGDASDDGDNGNGDGTDNGTDNGDGGDGEG